LADAAAPSGYDKREDANSVHASRSDWRERRRSNVLHAAVIDD